MQTVFDVIKDRLPITEVLATYITLVPSGSQFKAKCPFHNERSASFSVSPDRGLYYCFGCGAKGDIFTFVEQFEGVDKKGALKILADRAGVVLSRDHGTRESTDPLFDVLEAVTTRYQTELLRHPDVLEYLHARGIEQKTIETFRIGYAPDEWRFVANTMHSDQEAAIGERAGLIKKTPKPARPHESSGAGGGYYDRFRRRIMFPLSDTSGRVVGFSGRLFPEDGAEKESPKYLNSPETELFQKSRILFGFDKAKVAIRQHNFAILVEGQVDCVLAQQAGFKNTVATSGTAVSEMSASDPSANLAVLARLTPNIFLAFDGDAAGQKALDRAAIVALRLGMNPKVVPLPAGTDPAEYILAHGASAWKELLKESQHFILHQVRNVSRHDLSPHALVQTLKERVFPFLVRVQSPVEQGSYVEAIAQALDLSQSDLAREVSLFAAKQQQEERMPAPPVTSPDTISVEERFLALVSRYPTERGAARKEALAALSFEEHAFAFHPIPDERMTELHAVIERDYGNMEGDERDLLAAELSKKIEDRFFITVRSSYSQALHAAENAGDEAAALTLMTKLQTLNQRRHTSR